MMPVDKRLAAVLRTLSETYGRDGVRVWWNTKSKVLKGMTPRECWESEDEALMQRVEQLAESLTGQVAT